MQAWEERYFDREEGREEGRTSKMKELIAKKKEKGKSIAEIAEDLEESVSTIEKLMREL